MNAEVQALAAGAMRNIAQFQSGEVSDNIFVAHRKTSTHLPQSRLQKLSTRPLQINIRVHDALPQAFDREIGTHNVENARC